MFESREERVADGREVDPKWMQENNMVGGSGGIMSFTNLADGQDLADMRDPSSIMANVQSSIGGYGALHALEGGYEDAKDPYGSSSSTVATKASTKPSKTAYDLFHTPHNFGSGMKAIGAPKARKATHSYKYR